MALVGTSSSSEPPKKKKGPRGPNPLSVKKKKTTEAPSHNEKGKISVSRENQSVAAGQKRKVEGDEGHDGAMDIVTAEQVTANSTRRKRKRRKRNRDNVDIHGELDSDNINDSE